MTGLAGARAVFRTVSAYLREISGKAAFERHCRAHSAAPLSRAERRRLWREHTRRTARERERCC
ncbi:hypothetical protein [Streptomyces sp. Caat 7-52]|uniref:hypothetical protein n=1 Tax=Streptomyces sp. Caat 7-52 TaxID=2949637 RepID=UPI002035A189|nr:hypothetical protein [Streptomyces sp. Caat 7-52]